MRTQPTSKSRIVGRLSNGPEGAQLLGIEGKWSKVRVNGVVGYVWSADLQSTPTEPVYINASDVVGNWIWTSFSDGVCYTIHKNGKFSCTRTSGADKSGTWYLSRDKLVLKFSNGNTVSCPVNGNVMVIDGYEFYKE